MADNALNIAELKENNRHRILEALRYTPLSRAELSRAIGLTKSSITALTNEMIADGIIYEAGSAPKSYKAGRTGILLDIKSDYGIIIGINIHRKRISVAAIDLKGKAVFKFSNEVTEFGSTEQAFDSIIKNLESNIKSSHIKKEKIISIGVASPGPIDFEKGVILEPPNFSIFNNFSIVERLQNIYGCSVFLENNSVALALLENHTLKGNYGRSLFAVISDGIGGTFLQDGEIYRGSHGVAGELGHISINFEGEKCVCGNYGCLEQYATLSALKNRFGFERYENVVDSALAGDEKSQQIIDYIVNALGTAFVTAVNLFDLDKIILYGEYSYKSQFITEKIEEFIKLHSITSKSHKVSVVASIQNLNDVAIAAAMPAHDRYFKNNI